MPQSSDNPNLVAPVLSFARARRQFWMITSAFFASERRHKARGLLFMLLGLLILYVPALWRFYMQGKVLPVYKQLRKVEVGLPEMDLQEIQAEIERLNTMEMHVTQRVRVSAAYLPEVFHLRDHIRSVIVDLLRRQKELEEQKEGGAPPT